MTDEVSITAMTVDDAMAANAAKRGPENRYRALGLGSDEDGDDGPTWAVVSEEFTSLDMLMGDGEVFALCSSLKDAQTVAEALNKHFSN